MDYSDTTVMIPVKDEPAAGKVARSVLKELKGSKVLVIYKGDRKSLDLDFEHPDLTVTKQTGSGKGSAMVQAARNVDTDILCFIDGDATYDVTDLKKVISMVRNGADMAIGNRFEGLDRRSMPRFIEFGNKVITLTGNALFGMHLRDSQTGLRAIRKEVFDSLRLKEQNFGIESEMNIKCKKRGYKVVETPIRYYERVGETKQVKLVGGINHIITEFKFLFK